MKRASTFAVVGLFLCGCAAMKSPTAGSVNQNITAAIADAGAAAIAAEQEYTSGQIPQTPTNRTVINDLGASYEEAKKLYSVLLTSEAAYNAAQLAQVSQCAPGTGSGAPANLTQCQTATQAAVGAKAQSDATAQKFNTALSTMVTKTSAVKAITK